MTRHMRAGGFAVILFVALTPGDGQTKYASGQDVAPVFEGWEPNTDGSFTMVFGYLNRNYEEEPEIPIGPNNMFEPAPADQGRPTHFYPRRQEFIFKIKVPKDWGTKDLVWTLTSAGKTNKAYGTLQPVWEISNMVYQENRGSAGDLSYPGEPNSAPSIEMVGSSQRTVKVGEPLTVTVEVSDDGHPLPRTRRMGGFQREGAREYSGIGPKLETPITQAVLKLDPGVRLGVTWILYRGEAGAVRFDPMRPPVVKSPPPGSAATVEPISGKATTTMTFSRPGQYLVRAYGDDGMLAVPLDVNVTVQP